MQGQFSPGAQPKGNTGVVRSSGRIQVRGPRKDSLSPIGTAFSCCSTSFAAFIVTASANTNADWSPEDYVNPNEEVHALDTAPVVRTRLGEVVT